MPDRGASTAAGAHHRASRRHRVDRHPRHDPERNRPPAGRQDCGGRAPTSTSRRAPTVIDVSGKFMTPGLIDAHSHIAADSINEGGHLGQFDGRHRGRARSHRRQHLSRPGGRPDHRERSARQRQSHRRQERGHQAALGQDAGPGPPLRRSDAGDQVRARRKSQSSCRRQLRAQPNPPLRYPTTRLGVEFVIRDAFTPRQGVPEGVEGLRAGEGSGRPSRSAATRSAARAARRGARRQAARARAHLPCRRNADADAARRGDGLPHCDVPARARGISGRQGNGGARRGRLDVLGLVGLQGRGGRRHAVQRGDHGAQGRAGLDQFRQRRARAAAEHRGRENHQMGRAFGGRGARARHDQPGKAAAHRQPRRLARSRQGRGRHRLVRTIRSAPTPSSIASTSTARCITTGRPRSGGSPSWRRRRGSSPRPSRAHSGRTRATQPGNSRERAVPRTGRKALARSERRDRATPAPAVGTRRRRAAAGPVSGPRDNAPAPSSRSSTPASIRSPAPPITRHDRDSRQQD